ncbi:unnamed protein product, partial [Prorocentrum cordatum]
MGVDFGVARWLPRASAASVGKDLERDPGAWLRLAARSVRPGREDGSAAVFFARWWLEVRWGLARVSSTPPPVLRDLRELQEARRFVASAGWSEELSWAALAWPVEKLAQADGLALAGCPQGLAQAAVRPRGGEPRASSPTDCSPPRACTVQAARLCTPCCCSTPGTRSRPPTRPSACRP